MSRVALSHAYDAPARAGWRICTDFAALADAFALLVAFDGLPGGRIRQGQVIEVGVRLFGRLPPRPCRMEAVALDEAGMALRSREMGAGVRRWDHSLSVTKVGVAGARADETVDVDAGPHIPVYAAWARLLCRHRHRGRHRLLSKGT